MLLMVKCRQCCPSLSQQPVHALANSDRSAVDLSGCIMKPLCCFCILARACFALFLFPMKRAAVDGMKKNFHVNVIRSNKVIIVSGEAEVKKYP